MSKRVMFSIGLFLTGLLTASPAIAGDEQGVPVRVVVVDEAGKPVPTAVVRHPLEASRNPVNTFDGSWQQTVLYLPDGTELVFTPGMELELEVSAPGYANQHIKYLIRKRKNVVPVTLTKMAPMMDDEEDDAVIQFGRDKPIDGH